MNTPTIVILILLVIIVSFWLAIPKRCPDAYLIEYSEPPNDEMVLPNELELQAIAQAQEDADNDEFFRVSSGGGRPSGNRPSGGGRPSGNRPSGGGRPRPPHSGGGNYPIRSGYRPYHSYRRYRNYSPYIWGSYPYIYQWGYDNYNPRDYLDYNYYNNYPNYTILPESPLKRYLIRLSPKSDENPNQNKGYDKAYSISEGGYLSNSLNSCSGTSGARLDLKRGKTYEFDIYTSKDCVTGEEESEPFFFTTDPEGGSESGKVFNVKPTVNGTLRITIEDETPAKFYYQSSKHKFVGGPVYINA